MKIITTEDLKLSYNKINEQLHELHEQIETLSNLTSVINPKIVHLEDITSMKDVRTLLGGDYPICVGNDKQLNALNEIKQVAKLLNNRWKPDELKISIDFSNNSCSVNDLKTGKEYQMKDTDDNTPLYCFPACTEYKITYKE